MAWYMADVLCSECGQIHRVTSQVHVTNSPTEAGTVADLYPAGDLPPALMELLRTMLWCREVEEYMLIGDPARVVLTPYVAGASR